MTWSKIVGVLKRLDSRLSDAVYLHGAVIILKTRVELIRKNLQMPPAPMSRVHCGSTEGNRSIANSVGQSAP